MNLKNYYYWFREAISPEICQKIIDLGTSKLQDMRNKGENTEGYTFGNQEKSSKPNAQPRNDIPITEIGEVDTYVRDSEVAWLNDPWLYDTIYPFINEANEKSGWNWQIDIAESFQFTKYSPGGFYGWHKDGGSDWNEVYRRYIYGITEEPLKPNGDLPSKYVTEHKFVGKIRKISLTLNLNPPGQYEGGDLKFDFGVNSDRDNRFHICEEIRPQGSMIMFPSFLDHCVTPVTNGTRYSLVLWTLGDPWK